ncbi:MAG TPA: phospholipase D-like domain-containing protein [Steroidobacteraceae bacterium]|nr:phospholipase D-like domain-containing protein [Steroidobacteraceae bacterium]
MTMRIEGNPGTDPQGDAPIPSPSPSPREGRLVVGPDGAAFIVIGNDRIPVDISALRSVPGGAPFTSVRRRTVAPPRELGPAIEAAKRARADFEQLPGVVAVRAGYKFENGRITKTPAVVVSVTRGFDAAKLPASVQGVPIDIAAADPYDLIRNERGGVHTEAFARFPSERLLIDDLQRADDEAEEVARVITYRPPPGAKLDSFKGALTITCHVSPDAGWHVLRPFIGDTRDEFVLGMYDFTAPHIYRSVRGLLLDSSVKWTQTLGPKESLPGEDDGDSTKADDKTEASVVRGLKRVSGRRFESAFAHVGSGQTFASAYHIKVGVRDDQAFWLSSGNWQSSNQPDIDFLAADADRREIARYNREWHVIVESPELAKVFKTYLLGDFATASEPEEVGIVAEAAVPTPDLLVPEDALLVEERAARSLQAFAPRRFSFTAANPVEVQPVLTPDNYIKVVRDLLTQHPPRHRLYFQNQSLNPVKQPTAEFAELMQLLVDFSNDDDLDVRIIFRNIGPVRKKLESLQAAGFNMKRIKMQAGCHTKGIIIDSRHVLIGSHNFTNDGIQFNRDASLVIHDEGIAKYYEDVFRHDWERLARPTIREELAPILAAGAEAAPRGYVRVPWSFYDEYD